MQQLLCKDLQSGDLMLKVNSGTFSNRLIALGQKLGGQANSQVTHAGVMFDKTLIIEAQGGGVKANDLRVQNKDLGYLVYRPTHPAIANGAGACAKLLFDIQGRHGNLKYNLVGTSGTLGGRPGSPQSRGDMDALLDRILAGKTHPMFCSQFVVYLYQFVAEQNGIAAATLFNIRDAKVSPATLAALLQSNGYFAEAGYLIPKER
jgi:hypothetical protein